MEQNWPNKDANWFYNVTCGSRLVPYSWFLKLELPNSEDRISAAKNMWDLGFIPRIPGAGNPDGLPIGFAKDGEEDWLGLNCSACHTSQIHYNGTGYLVDGSSGLIDMSGLLQQLHASLEKTKSDEAKFDRFAANVIGANPSSKQKDALQEQLGRIIAVRKGYNDRNVIYAHDYARFDAFGSILNELTSRFLDLPVNARPANAPVSIPFIWDTPHHDVVQWNGSASNSGLGALGRNTGEILGVHANFGEDNIPLDAAASRVSVNCSRYEFARNRKDFDSTLVAIVAR